MAIVPLNYASFCVSRAGTVMSNSRDDQERLQEELRLTSRAFGQEVKRLLPKWQLSFGPVVFRSSVDPENIARIYILFNISCLVVGVILIFLKGAFQVLGISLIVGGLFSFGAFVAQVWTVAAERGHEVLARAIGRTYDDEKYGELRRLAKVTHELQGALGPSPPAARLDTTTDTSGNRTTTDS
jgi:hypothetical protein